MDSSKFKSDLTPAKIGSCLLLRRRIILVLRKSFILFLPYYYFTDIDAYLGEV